MAKTFRKYLIAGNWKMNKTGSEGSDLINEINIALGKQTDVGVAVCPPFTALESCAKALEDSNVQLGAQNMHPKSEGAYTGEVSPVMLRDLFCTFVVLGHSERREYFKESDAFINEKVLAALDSSLKPILCVGETLEQREANETFAVVKEQLVGGLKGVTADAADNLVIAYEPVWAIGTGKTATPEMAQEVHKMIRDELSSLLGAGAAAKIRILYGGSMKPENASSLMDQPDIDGGLIGGAALKAKSFVELVEIASSK
ncbi:triose-phosphate isomerase [Puniceicoccales bacterium CK1056]|uniref:Triosephosphate isomerase n=1 Tax=Oceanipulchritudo coccoides TaxID=2706888 RepID=A0A6B2M458_9BACT|nr:triose-phosphate isomerase [Oceanipulchritudo coccoides]NDV62615.1 triose-phosphate isomerase [Oceanipulchritudo coccoides]